jgi:ABC-type multidrug transport system permease subunit
LFLQVVAVFCFLVWYYPVGLYQNAQQTDTIHSRSTLALLAIWVSFLFASSFAHMLIAGIESAEIASSLSTVFYIMMYIFSGVLAGPSDLPRFWIFMYRVNPFTYLVSSLLAASTGDASMHCADNEVLSFSAPSGLNCEEYMADYLSANGGYVLNPLAHDSEQCNYCALENTNQYLSNLSIDFNNRWRDFGLLWVFVVVNTVGAVLFYWVFRVPKGKEAKTKG